MTTKSGLLATKIRATYVDGAIVPDGRLAVSLGPRNSRVQSRGRLLYMLLLHHILGVLLPHHELPLLLQLILVLLLLQPVLILLADICYFLICEGHELASTGIGVPTREYGLQPGRERKGRHLVSGWEGSFECVEVDLGS